MRLTSVGRFEVFCLVITAGEERLVETGGLHRVGSDKLTYLFGDVLKIGNQTPPGTVVDDSRGLCRADLRFAIIRLSVPHWLAPESGRPQYP